jgi:hypothetical protein
MIIAAAFQCYSIRAKLLRLNPENFVLFCDGLLLLLLQIFSLTLIFDFIFIVN